MLPELNAVEARIIGCLMEKSITTPNQYPLTLNALTNACNQKSSRDPVMNLDKGEVLRTLRGLDYKNLVRIEENFKSGVDKYVQRFCNSRYSGVQLEPDQFAVVCVLLLRGPRTPGELRANSARLHSFADNAEVVATLNGLIDHEQGPLVIKLPRTPGRKDAEYMHLLSGSIEAAEGEAPTDAQEPAAPVTSAPRVPNGEKPAAIFDDQRMASLEARVEELEAEVARLTARLTESS